jgi:hypothetical protein
MGPRVFPGIANPQSISMNPARQRLPSRSTSSDKADEQLEYTGKGQPALARNPTDLRSYL